MQAQVAHWGVMGTSRLLIRKRRFSDGHGIAVTFTLDSRGCCL